MTEKLTLEPIDQIETFLIMNQVESSVPAGFRVGWMDGEAEGVGKYELYAGAGVGSKYLIANVGGRWYVADMAEWFRTFIQSVTQSE